MKLTAKNFTELQLNKADHITSIQNLKMDFRQNRISDTEYTDKMHILTEDLEEIEEKLKSFDHKKVNVSYMIGYRSYYREVHKIGKFYFERYHKLTQSNGYYSIEEIEKITDKMKNEMISDSYYY